MKKLCCVLLLASGISSMAVAQSVTVGGEVPKPYTLTAATMKQLKRTTLNLKAHDGNMHQFSGVLLADILAEGKLELAEGKGKKIVSSYVLVNAGDNYKAVYALAEFDTMFTGNNIILADEVDGKPLPAAQGPFQMIVPGEKKFGRWVRQVKGIKLVTVSE